MGYRVILTGNAVRDLAQIRDFIALRDSPSKADHVIAKIEEAVLGLSCSPHRGPIPHELRDSGVDEFREVFFKPYRIFYYVERTTVHVVLIADGRRDMRTLLQQRLLQS